MPNFKKSTGYKMKGFTYPGESPLKVSDSDLVEMQQKLNKAELDFREPGWAQVAKGMHEGAKSVLSSSQEVDETETGNGKSSDDASNVTDIIKSMEVGELNGG